MVTVVQLVRASDCGSECRGFESHQSPSSHPSQLHVVRDFFVLPLSSRFPSFSVVRRLLFGAMRLLQRNAGACRCVRVTSSLLAASVLPVVPRLLGCSPFFGAAYECAHERCARVGDIGVNLSTRSHREIRESTKTCILSRDLSALRAAAVLRFPPVNESVGLARIYTRASVAFRFLPSLLHRVAHWVGC